MRLSKEWMLWAAVLLALAVGVTYPNPLGRHPDGQAARPERWPRDSSLALSSHDSTVVLFLHPRCACANGDLDALGRLMQENGNPKVAYVLFARPAEKEDDWEVDELWERAASLPHVVVLPDPSGREAARFGVHRAGEAAVYASDGVLSWTGQVGEWAQRNEGERAHRLFPTALEGTVAAR